MSHAVTVVVDGGPQQVDGRDVAQAVGLSGPIQADDPRWRLAAERYVEAHPRPAGGLAIAQRLALLRVLAAGPARTATLLAAMRQAGWVAASDLENRLRDLRGGGKRGAGRTVTLEVVSSGDLHRLATPFALLDETQRSALGLAKSLLMPQARQPLVAEALQALDGLLPAVGPHTDVETVTSVVPIEEFRLFEAAREARTPVRVAYYSMKSAAEKRYLLVPVEYVPVGPALKAVCVVVDKDGRRQHEWQFAVDRIRRVEATGLEPLDAADLELRRATLHLEVTDPLYRIMWDRNQYGIRDAEAVERYEDQTSGDYELRWEVRGTFPVALGWDVMEQMCAWAGSVMVHEPLWLVNAVARRLRAGIRALETAEFELVKPEPDRVIDGLREAIYGEEPEGPPPLPGPRKLEPPGP